MLIDAFSYKVWADDRTIQAVNCIDKQKYKTSYVFVLQQINHMVIVEELFRSRLTNDPAPHQSTNTDFVPESEELKKRLKESGGWYINYASKLKNENRHRMISFTFADGKRGSMSVEEILFHVLNHGSYHRGSIARALDLADVSHPADGYGIYIHEKEPARR